MLAVKCLLGAGVWGPARMAVTELEVDSPWPFHPRGVLLPVATGHSPPTEVSVVLPLGRGGRDSRDHFLVLCFCGLAQVTRLTSVRAPGEVCPIVGAQPVQVLFPHTSSHDHLCSPRSSSTAGT